MTCILFVNFHSKQAGQYDKALHLVESIISTSEQAHILVELNQEMLAEIYFIAADVCREVCHMLLSLNEKRYFCRFL